jgi:hypothetical protein
MANLRPMRHVTAAACIVSLSFTTSLSPAFAASAKTCPLQAVESPNCLQPPPPPAPPRMPEHRDHLSIGEILAFIAIFIAVVVAADTLTGHDEKSVDALDRDGPKPPEREMLGRYQVQGLVYPNWPLVVEVRTQPGATVFVQIVPDGASKDALPPLVISDQGGMPRGDNRIIRPVELSQTERGMLARFVLPANLKAGHSNHGANGDDGFRSARLSVVSGRMQDGEFVAQPVEVLAIGAGPNAVGSAAVVISRFDPAPVLRRALYTVTFNEKRRFNYLHAELVERQSSGGAMQRPTVDEQDVCVDGAGTNLCVDGPPNRPYRTGGEWPRQPGRQLSSGQSYHMQLRAWSPRSPEGGWVLDLAPQAVTWP